LPKQNTGLARAEKAKLDLTRINQAYFDRTRSRIMAAGKPAFMTEW
jgi:hypothetical protein